MYIDVSRIEHSEGQVANTASIESLTIPQVDGNEVTEFSVPHFERKHNIKLNVQNIL